MQGPMTLRFSTQQSSLLVVPSPECYTRHDMDGSTEFGDPDETTLPVTFC